MVLLCMAIIVITIALNCDNCNGIPRSGGLHGIYEFNHEDFDEFDARNAGTGGPSSSTVAPLGFDRGITPIKWLKRKVRQLQRKMAAMSSMMDSKFLQVDNTVDNLDGEMDNLGQNVSAMSSMMDSKFLQVGGRIDHVNNTVDNLDGEMDNLGQNVTAMSSMMDSKFLQVGGRIDHVNNTVDNLDGEMDNLGQNVSAMSSMMDSKFLQVGGRIDHVNNTVDNLDGEMDNLGQNVSALDSKVIQVELSIDNVNNTLTNEVNNLESQMESLEQDVSDLIESFRVRLGGGSKPNEGYVEAKGSNGQWGGVCDDKWEVGSYGIKNAQVVCRMLGYSSAEAWFGHSSSNGPHTFGNNPYGDSFVLDDLICTGAESTIFDCPNVMEWVENCGASEIAGVRCSLT